MSTYSICDCTDKSNTFLLY